jgi:ubiquinone/menaquinone biosynthesis C-methylase UbiE/predicted  nucleic acid-binding Zn-ribbon protein
MIETTIPEINVSELMERVRAKVEESRYAHFRSTLPPLQRVKEIGASILPKTVTPKTEKILRATQVAREATTISRWIPKPFRGLFRRQSKFNHEVLRAIESLSNTNAQFADRLRHLIACVEIQDHGIQHLAEVRRNDGQWMDELARIRGNDAAWREGAERLLSSLAGDRRKTLRTASTLAQQIAAVEQKSAVTEAAVKSVAGEVHKLKRQFETMDSRLATLDQESRPWRDQIASFEQKTSALADHLSAVRELRDDFNRFGEHLRALQVQADGVTALAADLQRELAHRAEQDNQLGEQLRAETAQGAAVRQGVESLEQRHTSDSAFIKAELSRQSKLVHNLIDRTNAAAPAKRKRAADDELSEAAAHRLDAFYFSFENRFRGSREEIKRRLGVYLPIMENCRAGTPGRPMVDLGCGRGEWLELLKQKKLTGTGVDLNQAMIDQCNERKLKVVQADAVEFLRQLPDDSQGAITGFHIIEHLPLDTLVDLIGETFRVLQPGGVAIFESPNCKNLTVGACYFYIDPTHRNPVFPETAQFMLETTGFERVTLEYLAPVETTDVSDIHEHPAHLRELLYGPRDFGVIGYKPTAQQMKRLTKAQ